MRRRRPWSRRFGRRSWLPWTATAARLEGPLYAVVGAGRPYQGGSGSSHSGRKATVSLEVRHVRPGGELEVRSSDEPPWAAELAEWRLVSDWTSRATRPEVLSFPLVLRADRWERDVLVDGVPVRFVFVGDEATWCAVGQPGGRDVTLSASGWSHDGVALVTIDAQQVSAEVPDRG